MAHPGSLLTAPAPPDSCTRTLPHPRGLECKAPHSQHALCTHPPPSWKNPELGLAPSFPCPRSSSAGGQLCSELHPRLSGGHFWDVRLMPFPPFNDRDPPYAHSQLMIWFLIWLGEQKPWTQSQLIPASASRTKAPPCWVSCLCSSGRRLPPAVCRAIPSPLQTQGRPR